MNHGQPLYRESDDELLGFLAETAGGWEARTVFGYPLVSAASRVEAEAVLHEHGLACLAGTWFFRDGFDGQWYSCAIQEANPERVTVGVTDYGHRLACQQLVIEGEALTVLRR